MKTPFKKILLLGSWALKIGEAGEFDYSGSQAIKALKEEWIEVILINPNIATVQTDPWFADKIYFYPVTPYFVEKVIEKEKPEAILLSFGWQTALNCGLTLDANGVLKKYGVQVLWTPTSVIEATEDRKKFNQILDEIQIKYAKSKTAESIEEAKIIANEIGYPVLVRAAFALGWLGSGFAHNEEELTKLLEKSFSYSSQVIIDESLAGWKELEYEVVRDNNDNCITVCNMENIDPMGIHTGESIVIAPSQTLSNTDYHLLRDVALTTIRHLGIIGECNIQFAYDPKSTQYRVIEVNARLSRSSALASKVTGYPLAYVAAKIGLGYNLDEIKNSVTWVTTAFFEPSLDYVVCKIPRWDLEKFEKVDYKIGSEMKSVWEVMAIGRSIEEVLQKALRNLDIGVLGFVGNKKDFDFDESDLDIATPKRMFAIARALLNGKTIEQIHEKTHIDLFFLSKLENIVQTRNELTTFFWKEKTKEFFETLKKAKKQGFSDKQIAYIMGEQESIIRTFRKENNIVPVVKKIDTLAWEFPSITNYLYTTYHGTENDIVFEEENETKIWDEKKENPSGVEKVSFSEMFSKKVIVLGSWSYRIGSSVEFDWCSVNALKTLKNLGYETIMLNFNPETVSTDFDSCNRLYFDEINLERILDIYEREKPLWVIVSMGGQIAQNLAMALKENGVNVLGTSPNDIDKAEDRNKFSQLLDTIEVEQPKWAELTSLEEALDFGKIYGYPVIIRPSYVLSGANMRVCSDEEQLSHFLTNMAHISKEHPTVISKFWQWVKEIEVDGVAQNGNLVIYAMSEHIENAWVHSWDATVVLPAQKLYIETVRKIKKITKKIIKELSITGPFNIQYLARENEIRVIECNLRASRSFPFVSKVTGYNFIEFATKSLLWIDIHGNYNTLDLDYVGVKAPQFSFHRLKGADPKLGIEMASTGEVGCIWESLHEAFLTAYLAVGMKIPEKNILVSLWKIEEKVELIESMKMLVKLWYTLYGTSGTKAFYEQNGIDIQWVEKASENQNKNILTMIQWKYFDCIINTPCDDMREEERSGYFIRRTAVDKGISLITNTKVAKMFIESLFYLDRGKEIHIQNYDSFIKK